MTALINLGAISSILRNNQEAIQAFEKAISISPKETKAYLGLGKIYAVQNDAENANRCFKIVIKLDPNGNLGNIAQNSILPERDLPELNLNDEQEEWPSIIDDFADIDELYSHGFKFFLNSDFYNASKLFQRYLKDKPEDSKAWAVFAICQLRSGDRSLQ